MKNFLQVGDGVDVLPIMLAVNRRPDLWDRHTYRTSFTGTPFAGMNDILLRYSAPEKHEHNADPLALVNDTAGAVEFVIDRTLWEAAAIQAHPLVNTATTVLAHADLEESVLVRSGKF